MTRHKLVRAISAQELETFLEELSTVPDVTGQKIRDLAETKFGVEMGHDAANNFRKDVYGQYLDRQRQRADFARRMTEFKEEGTGQMFADASSEELQQQVFEFMMSSKLDLSNPEHLKRAEALANIIKGGRSEDRKKIKELNEQLAAAQAQQKQTASAVINAAKDKGASPELIDALRQSMNFRPVTPTPETTEAKA